MAARNIEEDVFGLNCNKLSINSKAKGNSNERAAAKALQEWTNVKFVRVPMSGGLRRVDSDKITGDIIPDTLDKSFYFPFNVETKALKKITTTRMLRTSSMVFTIWKQCMSDAIRGSKLPMALLRQNGMDKGEYFLVLDAVLGGTIMALNVPTVFSGANHTYSLIGFMLSDVKLHMPYKSFAAAIARRDFIAQSTFYTQS